ncbi:DUF3152 domain-containing protein [Streptomyces sp. 549]|uniref:DUF3152 domain-containing protein n=1 Tax=Streptomyces sp. 549 TaxID=3049076 RepID=UPI0024C395AA|nr:DUF3152 domain-containing protein [Streptomyces sp. 549]MDK1476287.1 DUF3152 domain-containing protein [Streptomyces sp. 549]
MGRHSRPRRASSEDTAGIPLPPTGDRPAPRPLTPPQAPRPQRQEPGGDAHVRGGHPQHPEHGSGPYGRGPGGPARRPPPGGIPAQRAPGPRQDYVDAFAFASDAQRAGADTAAPPHSGPAPGRGRAAPGAPGSPDASAPLDDDCPDGPWGEAPEDEEPPAARHGRTLTGVAAAAVTTVLAVLVAGQVAGERRNGPEAAAAGQNERGSVAAGPGGDVASRSDGRPTPADGEPEAAPLSFEQQFARAVPLDPDFAGEGRFTTVAGQAEGPGSGKRITYRVDVESDLGLDSKVFARAVHETLNDKRSWANGGARTFERVSSGSADFAITLASPGTTAVWCAKSGLDTTEDNVSCDSASTERVMINGYRWAQGADTFGPERMRAYRQMLINHEVGHRLGFGHVDCPREGALAPVMMQQTKFLTVGGATCRPNAWPFPDA